MFTPCYQSSLCFTCSILANSSKTLHQSSNKDSVSMCFLDTVSNQSLIAELFKQWAHRSVMTIGLSIWNGRSKSEYQFDDWEKTKLTRPKVQASVTSKARRDSGGASIFPPRLRRQEDAFSPITLVNITVKGSRFLEFTEPNWRIIKCTLFSLYEIISSWNRNVSSI